MHHQEFQPLIALTDILKCFWYDKRDFGERESSFEIIPDGYAEIIFYFGSSCSISYNGCLQVLPSPFMIGLLNQPAVVYSKNVLEIIGIRCFPWTVFNLLGLPSGKDGVRIFKHRIAQLQPTLNTYVTAGKIAEAVALVQQHFIEAQSDKSANNTLLKAGSAMIHANGAIAVSQVAAAAHATVRTLERKFKRSSGYSVKDVSGLMRFEQVRNQLWLHPKCNLAGLALELGYTDQAHLSRAFKRYSGTTPAAFAKRAKKGKEFLSNNFVVFTQI